MKKIIITVFAFSFLFSSCWVNDDGPDPEVTTDPIFFDYEPVVMLRSDFEASTKLLPSQPLVNSGKIYVRENVLLVGEKNQGFHIFDNSDPSSPVNMAFLQVLGSSDVSIKGNLLYLNNATDLVALKADFENESIEITKRVKNAFPELLSPNGMYAAVEENEIVAYWKSVNN